MQTQHVWLWGISTAISHLSKWQRMISIASVFSNTQLSEAMQQSDSISQFTVFIERIGLENTQDICVLAVFQTFVTDY